MRHHEISEQSVNFYLDELCAHADEVYRMSYLLTLNQDRALKCVEATFDLLCETLEKVRHSNDITLELIAACWATFQRAPTSSPTPDSSLAETLRNLSLEERATLATIDVWGLSIEDAAQVLRWSPEALREHLARTRKKICALDFGPFGAENRQRNSNS